MAQCSSASTDGSDGPAVSSSAVLDALVIQGEFFHRDFDPTLRVGAGPVYFCGSGRKCIVMC